MKPLSIFLPVWIIESPNKNHTVNLDLKWRCFTISFFLHSFHGNMTVIIIEVGGGDDCYSKIKMIPGLNTSDYTALKKHYKINIWAIKVVKRKFSTYLACRVKKKKLARLMLALLGFHLCSLCLCL